MKALLSTAALALSTLPLLAQAGERGVSHPDPAPIIANDDQAPITSIKNPDAQIVTSFPATAPTSRPAYVEDEASAYHPYHPDHPQAAAYTATLSTRAVAQPSQPTHDIDGDIVTSVPLQPGEMPEGTLLKVRMNDSLSTKSTLSGAPFSATITEDVRREGTIVIPAGSLLEGNVTEVHGGKRIAGRAAIHIEPRRVRLPDGRSYMLHAQVIDTTEDNAVSVNNEGTILRRDHPKEMLAIVSLATGSAAVAGAVVGGGLGAAVGAGLGAGVSTILWLKQDRQAALPKDTGLVFSLTTPMMMQPSHDGAELRP